MNSCRIISYLLSIVTVFFSISFIMVSSEGRVIKSALEKMVQLKYTVEIHTATDVHLLKS